MKLLSNIYKERLPLLILATIFTSIYYIHVLSITTPSTIYLLFTIPLGIMLGTLLHMAETNQNT